MSENTDAKPVINVTPLIDVLLVLLIIFMLIAPLKPASFKANIPSEPKVETEKVISNPLTLIVSVNPDYSLSINNQKDFGTITDPQSLIAKLSATFKDRAENSVFREGTNEIEKTVFIKAPRNLPYGEVAKVVDAVKLAGASPIGLQIDKLD
jgi:biopolymer transport protein ExbD